MAASARGERSQPQWLHKIAWVLLVIFVPIIAAVVMIGVALQIVGVPVWQTTETYLGWTKTTELSPMTDIESQLKVEQAKEQTLAGQNSKLSQDLADSKKANDQLQAQVKELQDTLNAQADSQAEAKKKASVLVGMDPTAAAGVLNKLSVQDAAEIVAEMSSTDSAAILALIAPDKAGQILSMAAQISIENAAQQATANSADNTTNNTTG